MAEAAIDIYCDAFVARQRHELDDAPVVLIAPGVRGVLFIRLLVSDDSAYDRLVAEHGAASEIVVAGSSAGANLAATLALTPTTRDCSLASSMLTAHIHAGAPPFFVAHGDGDTIVLVEDARAFVAALRSVSTSPVVYAELPGAQHSFDLFRSPRFERVVEGIEVFCGRVDPSGRRGLEVDVDG